MDARRDMDAGVFRSESKRPFGIGQVGRDGHAFDHSRVRRTLKDGVHLFAKAIERQVTMGIDQRVHWVPVFRCRLIDGMGGKA